MGENGESGGSKSGDGKVDEGKAEKTDNAAGMG